MNAIERQCRKILADLTVPAPLSMAAMRAEVSRITGRKIEVRVVDMPIGGPCGLWVSIAGTDIIYVPASGSIDHRRHVELHELSHILAGHASTPGLPETVSSLVPDLDPALIERMLARTNYSDEAEIVAEMLATMIACDGTVWAQEPRRTVPGSAIVERIDNDLSRWT